MDPVSIIIEKYGVVNVVFLVEFAEKKFRNLVIYVAKSRVWRKFLVSGLAAAYS